MDFSLFNWCVNAGHVSNRDFGNLIRIIWHWNTRNVYVFFRADFWGGNNTNVIYCCAM